MKPSVALDLNRTAVRELVARYPLTNLRVFGSALHGTDHDASDLDLLVDPLPTATLFDVGGLQYELQRLLGVQVEVFTPMALPTRFRDRVMAEAEPV
ncbi:nucleotidyltransferase family protein [Pannonibacter sp. Q-1]